MPTIAALRRMQQSNPAGAIAGGINGLVDILEWYSKKDREESLNQLTQLNLRQALRDEKKGLDREGATDRAFEQRIREMETQGKIDQKSEKARLQEASRGAAAITNPGQQRQLQNAMPILANASQAFWDLGQLQKIGSVIDKRTGAPLIPKNFLAIWEQDPVTQKELKRASFDYKAGLDGSLVIGVGDEAGTFNQQRMDEAKGFLTIQFNTLIGQFENGLDSLELALINEANGMPPDEAKIAMAGIDEQLEEHWDNFMAAWPGIPQHLQKLLQDVAYERFLVDPTNEGDEDVRTARDGRSQDYPMDNVEAKLLAYTERDGKETVRATLRSVAKSKRAISGLIKPLGSLEEDAAPWERQSFESQYEQWPDDLKKTKGLKEAMHERYTEILTMHPSSVDANYPDLREGSEDIAAFRQAQENGQAAPGGTGDGPDFGGSGFNASGFRRLDTPEQVTDYFLGRLPATGDPAMSAQQPDIFDFFGGAPTPAPTSEPPSFGAMSPARPGTGALQGMLNPPGSSPSDFLSGNTPLPPGVLPPFYQEPASFNRNLGFPPAGAPAGPPETELMERLLQPDPSVQPRLPDGSIDINALASRVGDPLNFQEEDPVPPGGPMAALIEQMDKANKEAEAGKKDKAQKGGPMGPLIDQLKQMESARIEWAQSRASAFSVGDMPDNSGMTQKQMKDLDAPPPPLPPGVLPPFHQEPAPFNRNQGFLPAGAPAGPLDAKLMESSIRNASLPDLTALQNSIVNTVTQENQAKDAQRLSNLVTKFGPQHAMTIMRAQGTQVV